MKPLLLFITLALISACAPLEPRTDVHVVVIERPVTLNWGMQEGETVRYQSEGIPGNIATFPNTRTPRNDALKALVLGAALPASNRVAVHILGVHEQVNEQGMLSTVIASTDSSTDLISLVQENPGALAVIEAGLLQLYGERGRSLGFRPAPVAVDTIASHRNAF